MPVTTNGVVTLGTLRELAAAALAPVDDTDPPVLQVADAVDPPALMLLYDDPWLSPVTMGCLYECRLEVRCVASRVEPVPGYDKLEELVAYVLGRMAQDDHQWPVDVVSAPRVFTPGNVPLLFASVGFVIRVAL